MPAQPAPNDAATIWHVLPEDTLSLNNSLGSFSVDGRVITAKLEEYLRDVVAFRCETLNADERIAAQLDRRIEVVSKAVTAKLETQMSQVVHDLVLARVRDEVAKLRISVSVAIQSPDDEPAKSEN